MENKLKFVREVSQDALITEKADVFLNGLLGVYDNNGNYFISPKIVEELISFEKAKRYVFDNSIFCESIVPGIGEIMFQIEYIKITKEKTCAKLYLLENVYKINGYLQNTIKTFLAEYVDLFENFIQKSYEHFNIVVDYDDAGRSKNYNRDAMLSTYLLAKKQYLISIESDVSDKLDNLYNRYFKRRIKVLTSSKDPFSKDVLKQFNDQYNLIEDKFLQNENFKDVNELLDKCIEDISETKDIYKNYQSEFDKKCNPALKEFYDESNELISKAQEKSTINLGKQDKRKVQEILADEQQFVETAVNDSKLSGIIEALNADSPEVKKEAVSDETLEQSQTMSEIIDKVKSAQDGNKKKGYINPEFIKAQKVIDSKGKITSKKKDGEAEIENSTDELDLTQSNKSENSKQKELDEKSHLPMGSEIENKYEGEFEKNNENNSNEFLENLFDEIKAKKLSKEIKTENSSNEIKEENSFNEIKAESLPEEIETENSFNEIKAESLPEEIEAEKSFNEIKAESLPEEIETENSFNEIKAKNLPEEIETENSFDEIKNAINPSLVKTLEDQQAYENKVSALSGEDNIINDNAKSNDSINVREDIVANESSNNYDDIIGYHSVNDNAKSNDGIKEHIKEMNSINNNTNISTSVNDNFKGDDNLIRNNNINNENVFSVENYKTNDIPNVNEFANEIKDAVENVSNAENIKNVNNVEGFNPVENANNIESISGAHSVSGVGNIYEAESANNTASISNFEIVDNSEGVGNVKNVDSIENGINFMNVNNKENVDNVESVNNIESDKIAKTTEVAENIKVLDNNIKSPNSLESFGNSGFSKNEQLNDAINISKETQTNSNERIEQSSILNSNNQETRESGDKNYSQKEEFFNSRKETVNRVLKINSQSNNIFYHKTMGSIERVGSNNDSINNEDPLYENNMDIDNNQLQNESVIKQANLNNENTDNNDLSMQNGEGGNTNSEGRNTTFIAMYLNNKKDGFSVNTTKESNCNEVNTM